jgi:hypothetical protein
MKTWLKLPAIAFLVSSLLIFGCRKDPSLKSAVITGYDLRVCVCCGGLMLNFNGETEPYKGDFYLVDNKPSELGITETTKFPVYIDVAYNHLEKCNGAYITITGFKLK